MTRASGPSRSTNAVSQKWCRLHALNPAAESLFGWIVAQIPVQPHKCSAFGLRGVTVRMRLPTIADQPKSYKACLTAVTLIGGCLRKRNSAKQALNVENRVGGAGGVLS